MCQTPCWVLNKKAQIPACAERLLQGGASCVASAGGWDSGPGLGVCVPVSLTPSVLVALGVCVSQTHGMGPSIGPG